MIPTQHFKIERLKLTLWQVRACHLQESFSKKYVYTDYYMNQLEYPDEPYSPMHAHNSKISLHLLSLEIIKDEYFKILL